jgi:DNA-binding response OmpR family regulator
MTKPFSLKQLAARMETVLRRCRPDEYRRVASEVRAGDLVLRLQSYEVLRHGVPVQLTPLEFRILYLLAMNEGQIIPYSRLVDYAWGYEGGDASLLKTHICHIRRKLQLPASGEGAIRSLATVGYSLVKQRRAAIDQQHDATGSLLDRGNDRSVSPLDAEGAAARGRRLAAV